MIPTEENHGDLFWFYGRVWDFEIGLYHVKISLVNKTLCGLLHGISFPFPIKTFKGRWKKIDVEDIEWN